MRKMSFPSNSSWYDTVNIIVMGFLLLFLIPIDEQQLTSIQTVWVCILACALSYLVGLIYHKMIEWISSRPLRSIKDKQKDYALAKAKEKTKFSGCIDFYDCYYMMAKEGMLGVVDVLDAQIAFIKNAVFMMCLYFLFALVGRFDDVTWYVENRILLLASGILVVSLSCWTWREILFRRYELIWLGGIHLKQLENKR